MDDALYEPDKPYLFISYRHTDAEQVFPVLDALAKRGYRLWYDKGIRAGEQWSDTLEERIAKCAVFVPFLSVSYDKSTYCWDEFVTANREGRTVVPVWLAAKSELSPGLRAMWGKSQGFSLTAAAPPDAFADFLDAQPEFHFCRDIDSSRAAPARAEVVTVNRPVPPTGAFVGREEQIRAIEDGLRAKQRLVVLYGMGGIGKSEICRKLFHEYADGAGTDLAGRIGWAMWRGTAKETFYGQFRDITEQNAELHWRQVQDHLRTLGGDLLMFLDNADSLSQTDAAELARLGCRFLITSRKRPERLYAVPAGTLPPEQCRVLYRRALREDDACTDDAPEDALDEILRLAAYHTISVQLLAKCQWAAGLDTEEMLSRVRESGFDLSGEDIPYLHNPEHGGADGEDAAFIEHMSRIFDLSQLDGTDTLRALQGMSLLAPNTPIAKKTAREWLDLPNLNGLNRAIRTGWLNGGTDNGVPTVSIHPIIAAVVRKRSAPDTDYIDAVAGRLHDAMDYEATEVFVTRLPIVPHAVELDRVAQSMEMETENYGKMLGQMGYLAYYQGDYAAALEWNQKALRIREKVLGPDHPDTATTYNNIAEVYRIQGDYAAALEWNGKALRVREKVLGRDHPSTATTYHNIGQVYQAQGDYAAALEWYQKALRICENALGMDHPSTATTYHNIGQVYQAQGDYAAALEWYGKALRIGEKVLGPDHPDTATTYNNIATVYADMGSFAAALEWYQKALRIREKVLGPDHPDTATMYNNLGVLYYYKGDYREALNWMEKALAVWLKVLGSEHPYTKQAQNDLAYIQRKLSDDS